MILIATQKVATNYDFTCMHVMSNTIFSIIIMYFNSEGDMFYSTKNMGLYPERAKYLFSLALLALCSLEMSSCNMIRFTWLLH